MTQQPLESIIDARLTKRLPTFKRASAFELDLHLQAGPGITVLFGASGSGKTLTLNCIAGFATPDEGRILVDQQLYFDASARVSLRAEQRRCGYLFQEDSLFPHLSIVNNLLFAGGLRKLRGRALRQRSNELLEAFELTTFASHKPAQLSGGQKQRAALARILIGDPRLILLDEPTRGLDARLRQSFYDILRQARARVDIPLLLVTHDLDECLALADTICLMDNGRFLQTGSAAAVFAHPASVAAARLLGLYAILPAEIRALDPTRKTSSIRVLDQEIEGPYLPGHLLGDRGFLCIRSSVPTGRALFLERWSAAKSWRQERACPFEAAYGACGRGNSHPYGGWLRFDRP